METFYFRLNRFQQTALNITLNFIQAVLNWQFFFFFFCFNVSLWTNVSGTMTPYKPHVHCAVLSASGWFSPAGTDSICFHFSIINQMNAQTHSTNPCCSYCFHVAVVKLYHYAIWNYDNFTSALQWICFFLFSYFQRAVDCFFTGMCRSCVSCVVGSGSTCVCHNKTTLQS